MRCWLGPVSVSCKGCSATGVGGSRGHGQPGGCGLMVPRPEHASRLICRSQGRRGALPRGRPLVSTFPTTISRPNPPAAGYRGEPWCVGDAVRVVTEHKWAEGHSVCPAGGRGALPRPARGSSHKERVRGGSPPFRKPSVWHSSREEGDGRVPPGQVMGAGGGLRQERACGCSRPIP